MGWYTYDWYMLYANFAPKERVGENSFKKYFQKKIFQEDTIVYPPDWRKWWQGSGAPNPSVPSGGVSWINRETLCQY